MNAEWKSDPRLSFMDPEKIRLLDEFSSEIANTKKANLLNSLLSLNQKAASKGLHFNDEETSLIVSVLTSSMDPREKKKVETLRLLSKKLAGKR